MTRNVPDTPATSVERLPDRDDVGELTDDFFLRAEISLGSQILRPAQGHLARRGRPPANGQTKIATNLRLDSDVIARLKADGPGWQTRANALLRQALDLPPDR